MNQTVITISQRKGGVGKSTSTLNLAHVIAEAGYRVLIIDLDDQQNTTRSISAVVQGDKTIEDLLLQEDITLSDVAVTTNWKNVSILSASANLSGVVKHLDQELGGHLILKEKLAASQYFDYIIIDTSPSLNILVINALCASDYLFIPLSSKFFSMQGLSQTLSSFNKIKCRLNPDLRLLGIAFVNHDKRNVLAGEVIEQVHKQYGEHVFDTVIGINIKIEEAQVKRESIIQYSPHDRGADQYRLLGKELLERIGQTVPV
jgi:chromosome partitioning protein